MNTHTKTEPFGVSFEQWRLVNAMLPREYYPELQVGAAF